MKKKLLFLFLMVPFLNSAMDDISSDNATCNVTFLDLCGFCEKPSNEGILTPCGRFTHRECSVLVKETSEIFAKQVNLNHAELLIAQATAFRRIRNEIKSLYNLDVYTAVAKKGKRMLETMWATEASKYQEEGSFSYFLPKGPFRD